jgi:ornithine decarboxylase
MTFDCEEEAEKIKDIYPEAEVVLRIAVEDTDAPCPMTMKFGAPRELWTGILTKCK